MPSRTRSEPEDQVTFFELAHGDSAALRLAATDDSLRQLGGWIEELRFGVDV